MKKENKKMAQQRRAAERKKEAQKTMVKKVITICVPILILALLFYIGIGGFSKNSSDETTTAAETETTTTDSNTSDNSEEATTESPSYLTDEDLTVKDGDTVNIDYIGYVAGEEFSGGNTNGAGTDLVIGSNSYIDDFEEQLIGAHPGDQVEVRVTFPEDYHEESLAGQEALFLTTVNGIYE